MDFELSTTDQSFSSHERCLLIARGPVRNVFLSLSRAFRAESRPVPPEHLQALWDEIAEQRFKLAPDTLEALIRSDGSAAAHCIRGFVKAVKSIIDLADCREEAPQLQSLLDTLLDIARVAEKTGTLKWQSTLSPDDAELILNEAFSTKPMANRWLMLV